MNNTQNTKPTMMSSNLSRTKKSLRTTRSKQLKRKQQQRTARNLRLDDLSQKPDLYKTRSDDDRAVVLILGLFCFLAVAMS